MFFGGILYSFKLKRYSKTCSDGEGGGRGREEREREGTGVTEQGMMGKLARRRLGSRGKGWREGGSEERGWA